MAQVIHGESKEINNLSLSKYSLTTQIIIINFFTSFLALIFIIIFNILLLNSSNNLEIHKKSFNSQIDQITEYLSTNAIKRILTFDDTCTRISKETNVDCLNNDFVDKNYDYKPPELDPTYTQQYIYSNFQMSNIIVKIFDDNWNKFADTSEFYTGEEEILILDIDSEFIKKKPQTIGFYSLYKKIYFNFYNSIQKIFDEQKLKKLKNDNITVMETIKTKQPTSYLFQDNDDKFKSIFASPILKDNKVYGVAIIIAPFNYNNHESAYQSILLTNFFIFFISIMFFLSLLFSKSIVTPMKILSQNTRLEREKSQKENTKIIYPNRRDEIGILSRDIKSMSDDLKKRIDELEEFAADVSHELKNPLSGIKSSIDLLKTEKIEKKNKEVLIKNMSEDIDRMNILISDISNYTLTQVEISEEAFEVINVNNFFNDFKISISHKNYSLQIEIPEKEIYLKINKNKFIQVLYNLFDNAESFIPPGSIILLSIKVVEKNCYIYFVDQGPGIPDNYKYKIFERFYTDRDDKIRSHSGLGLSISKNILESFGGKINLIKSPFIGFNGACFEIILPLKD